jgi:hypothetical protein
MTKSRKEAVADFMKKVEVLGTNEDFAQKMKQRIAEELLKDNTPAKKEPLVRIDLSGGDIVSVTAPKGVRVVVRQGHKDFADTDTAEWRRTGFNTVYE